MCDGVERCCGMHGCDVMFCGNECGRCMREGLECLELTRASAVSHVCECGVVWRLTLLGEQLKWTGARAFCEGVFLGSACGVCWGGAMLRHGRGVMCCGIEC